MVFDILWKVFCVECPVFGYLWFGFGNKQHLVLCVCTHYLYVTTVKVSIFQIFLMAFRILRMRKEARRNAKLDEIFQVPVTMRQWFCVSLAVIFLPFYRREIRRGQGGSLWSSWRRFTGSIR